MLQTRFNLRPTHRCRTRVFLQSLHCCGQHYTSKGQNDSSNSVTTHYTRQLSSNGVGPVTNIVNSTVIRTSLLPYRT